MWAMIPMLRVLASAVATSVATVVSYFLLVRDLGVFGAYQR
jgi:hypothetical protein